MQLILRNFQELQCDTKSGRGGTGRRARLRDLKSHLSQCEFLIGNMQFTCCKKLADVPTSETKIRNMITQAGVAELADASG